MTLDFFLQWGRMYEIEFFGLPKEQFMFLGRSNGFVICASESGVNIEWEKRGCAIQVPSAMAEFVYMVPESAFWTKSKNDFPEYIYRAENFETVDTMIYMDLIDKSKMTQSLSYLWYIDDQSPESKTLKWFNEKLMNISDMKVSDKKLTVYLNIAKNMLIAKKVKPQVVSLYTSYMTIIGTDLISNGKERWQIIVESQLNQLPF
jgi:hypothetical protein